MKKVLVVVDMQNDFVDGTLGSPQAQAIVPNVREKIAEHQNRADDIIFTRDTHPVNYLEIQEGRNLPVEHCIVGTEGWEIYGNLDANIDEFGYNYIDKFSFGYTEWKKVLGDNPGEIELVGLCSDICVVSNALILKALYPETRISVDAQCCAGVTEESHQAALLTMKMCQINVINE